MAKKKRRLSAAEKDAKQKRRKEFRTVFIGGKMKRVRRPPTIEGLPIEEFIRRNADPIFLHAMEMWEYIESGDDASSEPADLSPEADDDLPF